MMQGNATDLATPSLEPARALYASLPMVPPATGSPCLPAAADLVAVAETAPMLIRSFALARSPAQTCRSRPERPPSSTLRSSTCCGSR